MTHKPFREIAADLYNDPERCARLEVKCHALEEALNLAELRGECAASQQDVAASLGVSQANVSRIEHEEDLYLSTLRRYVAALGGELEVRAVFPDRTVTLIPSHS